MSTTLKLIQLEIQRLERKGAGTGLTLEDVKKLEILVKTGQSLITAPVAEPDDEDKSHTDEEILAALKAHKE